MRFDIPFQYKASYCERRRAGDFPVWLESEAIVDIADVDSADVSLAFLAADVSGITRGLSPIDGKPRRILFHRGSFWRELGTVARFQAIVSRRPGTCFSNETHDNPFAPDEFSRIGANLRYMRNHFHSRSQFSDPWLDPERTTTTRTAIEAASERGVRRWNDDHGQASMTELRHRAAAELAAVGDRIYQKCAEPCYAVRIRKDEVVVGLSLASAKHEYYRRSFFRSAIEDNKPIIWKSNEFLDDLWHIGRLDEAVDAARRIAAARQIDDVRVAATAREMSPGFALFADDVLAVDRAAWVAGIGCPNNLAIVTREAGHSWLRLRDALKSSGGVMDASVAAAVSELGTEWRYCPWRNAHVRNDIVSSGRSPWESDKNVFGDAALGISSGSAHENVASSLVSDMATRAARRWSNRPRNGLEWVEDLSMPASVQRGELCIQEVATAELAREIAVQLCADADDPAIRPGLRTEILLVATREENIVGAAAARVGEAARMLGTFRDPGIEEALAVRAGEILDRIAVEPSPTTV